MNIPDTAGAAWTEAVRLRGERLCTVRLSWLRRPGFVIEKARIYDKLDDISSAGDLATRHRGNIH